MSINIAEELKVVGQLESAGFNGSPSFPAPKYNTPITPRENYFRFLKNDHPMWTPCSADCVTIIPKILPDNTARCFVISKEPFDIQTEAGGKDYFGVEWEYIPQVGGSMVRPGNPLLVKDLEHWENDVVFPDLSKYDWEGSAEINKGLLHDDRVKIVWVMNGLYERLISFVEFENAAMALIDEDEQEAVHRLFSRLCDFYDELFDYCKRYFNADCIYFHDDWGSQRAPFFSRATVEEMLVPYLKRVCESAHKRGMALELHSCGKIEPLVPCMIEAGVDIWSGQPMNDRKMVMDKYGKDIKLNLSPDASFGATPEEYDASLKAFFDTYGDYLDCMVVSAMSAGHPKLYEETYTRSRQKFAEEK